jgi:hypothetical protein
MTDLLTPNAVVSQLLQLGRELEKLTTDLDQIEKDAVNAREDYVLAKETAFLKAEGTQYIREAEAKVATHVERIAAELADANVRGARAHIASIKARIDIGRSAAAALRAEISLDGVR